MTQLHQVLAADKDTKAHLNQVITGFYHAEQKPLLFHGMTKTYQPKDEDGDMLPPESVLVQKRAQHILTGLNEAFGRLFKLRATIDVTNLHAVASVMVDGQPITQALPTTHLLFLLKQVTDIATVIGKMPTLDPAQIWRWDANEELWTTDELKTARTTKVEEFVTVAPPTDKHAAQVAKVTKDVQAGVWTTRKLSGALPASEKAALLARVAEVKAAVKVAVTVANSVVVEPADSSGILDYIFA